MLLLLNASILPTAPKAVKESAVPDTIGLNKRFFGRWVKSAHPSSLPLPFDSLKKLGFSDNFAYRFHDPTTDDLRWAIQKDYLDAFKIFTTKTRPENSHFKTAIEYERFGFIRHLVEDLKIIPNDDL